MQEELLRVAEAKHRDAGRGIARVDSRVMQKLGMVSGDVIRIKGKNPVPAIVWPSYPEDAGKKLISIDGSTRNNLKAGIDDRVEIEKVDAKPAEKVSLASTQPLKIIQGEQYLRKALEGRPLMQGQEVRVETIGAPVNFLVKKTNPTGIVLINRATEVQLSKQPVERMRGVQITYEDIGGLRREIRLAREMIELPLRYPELFQKLGIDPPKGLLLYGPPGTGKTLLAKAVANEVDAHFVLVNGPEIVTKYYGESEQKLREIFEEAEQNAPAIIFIDEIDSIAARREEMSGDRQLERRVVSQLLSLMDGLKARGEVIVIAATNQPNILDPALRRGGRFDREMEIGVPDREGRKEILQVHTRGMPLAKGVDLDALADVTHGFVGADLTSLCKEAGMHALRELIPELDSEKEIPADVIDKLELKKEDFQEALKSIEPSALRQVFIEVPNVKWSDVGGLEEAKQELTECVEWPLRYPELYEYSNTDAPKGILLNGPPGTGKTLLAKALAHESDVNFISVKGPELVSKYIGESEKGIRETFRKAKQASPCIIFFDELDAIAPVRGSASDGHTSERVISQLLTELDGIEELRGVVVLAATNRADMIDPALLRPGRFDRIVEIGLPDEKTRAEIFKIHTEGKPLENVDLGALTKQTENFSGADIAGVCREAAMLAIREFVNSNNNVKRDIKEFKVKSEHFKKAFEKIKAKAVKNEKTTIRPNPALTS